MSYDIGLRIGIDGEAGYKQALKTINGELRNVGQELRAVTKEFEGNANSIDALTAKNRVLEKEVELHRVKVELLSKEYKNQTDELKKLEQKLEETKKAHSEDSEEVKKAQKEYDTQASKVRKLDSDIGTATATLNRYTKEMDANTTSIKDQSSETGKLEKELGDLKSEMGLLESDQKKLTSSFKLQRAELGENATEADKLELAQKQLRQQVELTDKVVQNLENQLDKTKRAYGENSKEVKDLETKLNNAKTEVVEFKNKLDDIEQGASNAGDGLDQLNQNVQSITLFEMADALSNVSQKLVGFGKTAMDTAMTYADSQTILRANLGLTESEAEGLNDIVKNIFENGVVGTVEEATNAVILAKQSFGELNNADLQNLTNQIVTIASRTGTDVRENVIAVDKLMGAFGITSDEALNLIAAGFQNGMNKNGDFLDTLNEYPFYFEQAGFSAKDMMQIIANGMENGAMNTDKAADAVKEFQIRLGDGSVDKVISSFSSDTQDMFQKWKNGEATVADVAKSIGMDLKKMSPNEQQAALSLLSSQFEDLGVDGAAALFQVGDAFEDTANKAKDMAEQSPGEKWEGALRKLQGTLEPIGNTLKDALAPALDALTKLAEKFSTLPEPVQGAIAGIVVAIGGIISAIPILAIFAASFNTLAPLFAGIAGGAGGAGAALAGLAGPVGIAIAAIVAIIAVLKGAWDNSEIFRTAVGEAFTSIQNTITGAFERIREAMAPAVEAFQGFSATIQPVLQELGDFLGMWIVPLIQNFINTFITGFTNIIVAIAPFIAAIGNLLSIIGNFVGMVFALLTGDWASAWQFGQNILQAAADMINNILQGLANVIALVVLTIAEAIRNACQFIYDNTIGKLIELAAGVAAKWEEIRGDTAAKWEEVRSTIVESIRNLPETLRNYAVEMLTKMADGIRQTASDVWGAMTQLAEDLKTKFKEALGIHSPSSVFKEFGYNIVQGLLNGLNIDSIMGWVNSMIEQIKGAFAGGNFNLQAAIEFIGTGAADFFKSIGIGGAKTGDMSAPVSGDITSEFGWRTHPIYGDQRFHSGLDIGAAEGTPVGAAGAGTVTQAGWNGGYGMSVTLDHGNGLSSLYAHLSAILVSVGEVVSKLQTIGLVGSTGDSTGAHLHFGLMENGEWIDPSELFGFDVGSRYIPQDMVALVHEGEMIVPRSENPYANSSGQIMPESSRSNQPLIIQVTLGNGKILAEALVDNLDDLIGIKTGKKARGMA